MGGRHSVCASKNRTAAGCSSSRFAFFGRRPRRLRLPVVQQQSLLRVAKRGTQTLDRSLDLAQ
jgi:hypothetical protein